MDKKMNIYTAINAVQIELCKTGITKEHQNVTQGYAFRGIDDIYNSLSSLMAEHGICIMPRVISRSASERPSKNGGLIFSVVIEAEFDFIYSADGSRHTVKMFGEAMDSGDKATNKALSSAYKYACIQTFAIPTKGDNDIDLSTHEPVPALSVSAPSGKSADKVNVVTYVPTNVTTNSFSGKNGKSYTSYKITSPDGNIYSTISETGGEIATAAWKEGKEISHPVRVNGKFLNAGNISMRGDPASPDKIIEEVPF